MPASDFLDVTFPEFVPQATQDADLLQHLGFLPGLKEILMVRQVHALEHATVWVLSEFGRSPRPSPIPLQPPDGLLGGMSTEQGFYLYGAVDPVDLRQAVHLALRRLVNGEWNLAVHPHCGTNLSVGMLLTTGLAAGFSLFAPKDPLGQLLGFGIAAAVGTWLTPDLGHLAQRYVTTAIPFNLVVDSIETGSDRAGRPYHFIRVRWVE